MGQPWGQPSGQTWSHVRYPDSDYDSGAGDLYSNAEISDEGYDSRVG